jgi:ParB-like nuclease family protein
MAETEPIPLDRITTEGTQARVLLSETIIREYADAMSNGDAFPPIDVYGEETTYWLADGFHRVHAATIAGHTTIAAVVHAGGQREALLHAVSANETHGHRRTDADRRHAVSLLLADPEWQAWNNSEIARQCRVSEFLVRTLRRELEPPPDTPAPSTRTKKVQRGGTTYTMRTSRIGSARASKPSPGASSTASATASIAPTSLAEQHEGIDAAPASSITSKTPTPELYVHEEETPAGPVVATQTEDEIAGEAVVPPPQPSLTDLWQQATPEERTRFVAMYHEDLRTLLAAWDAQAHHRTRPRTASPRKKQRTTSRPS